jgi:DNA-binding NtrC family response regulator
VTLPPLRERIEDLPLLVHHFVTSAAARFEREGLTISPEVMDRLQAHPWLGNVRELENCIERMVLLARGPRLTSADLPPDLRKGPEAAAGGGGVFELPPAGVRLPELERHLIVQALRRSRGSLGPAARLLGISYKTLQYRIQKFGIERKEVGLEGSGGVGPEPSEASQDDRAI